MNMRTIMKGHRRLLGLSLFLAAISLGSTSCSADDDDDTATPPTPEPLGFPGDIVCRPNSAGIGSTCRGAPPACLEFDGE